MEQFAFCECLSAEIPEQLQPAQAINNLILAIELPGKSSIAPAIEIPGFFHGRIGSYFETANFSGNSDNSRVAIITEADLTELRTGSGVATPITTERRMSAAAGIQYQRES
jgi:hypothetical protein